MPYTANELITIFTDANDGVVPDASTALLLQAYAVENQSGTITDLQTLTTALHLTATDPSQPFNGPEATTDVALAVYQFFSGVGNGGVGTSVTGAGLDYLVNPTTGGNVNALGGSYYSAFNQANRYINLAVSVSTGEGQFASSFAATYSGLTFAQTVQTAYEQIVGSSVVGATQAATAEAAITAQESYFQTFVSEYAPTANQDLAAKAAAIGYILEEAIKADVGAYANAIDNLQNSAANLGVTLDSLLGSTPINLLTTYGVGTTPGGTSLVLTTGVDHLQGGAGTNEFIGSLTPFIGDGKGPTLNPGDTITGGPAGSSNTLTLVDSYGVAGFGGLDTLPVGATITGIQNVILQTASNAGGFDVSHLTGVTSLVVDSSGTGSDSVVAAGTTDITVDHASLISGGVSTVGGQNVTVTDNAALTDGDAANLVQIGTGSNTGATSPTGTINVTTLLNVQTYGGTTVGVTEGGVNAFVSVGDTITGAGINPTGAVTINDTATATNSDVFDGEDNALIFVGGGTDVTVTAAGDGVEIGEIQGTVAYAPTGAISVTENSPTGVTHNFANGDNNPFDATSGLEEDVTVLGGTTVNVTTNTGAVIIGQTQTLNGAALAGELATGAVTVNDTSTYGYSFVEVFGGTDVTVTTAGGGIFIGEGAGATEALFNPTGAVTATIASPVTYDGVLNTAATSIQISGGASATATTDAGSVFVNTVAGAVVVADTAAFGGETTVQVLDGSTVTITDNSSTVTVGDGGLNNPTGAVSVTTSGLETGGQFNTSITIDGGVGVTVSTTGGSVLVGETATPVTGAVTVSDTFAGSFNSDSFTVLGGSGVSVTTTATSGAIQIGDAAATLNAAGTALTDAAQFASGNVTVVNEDVAGTGIAGAANVYGTSAVTIGEIGATSVSVTGASSVAIVDEETTAGSTGAIGASTLASVSLTGVGGTVTVTSDALTSLSIADDTAAVTATLGGSHAGSEPAHALTLTLADNTSSITVNDATATSVTVSGDGFDPASGSVLTLNAAGAASIAYDNSGYLDVTAATAAVTTIAATGSGELILGDLTGDAKLTKVDVSGSSGVVFVEINPETTTFKGGSGVDVVEVTHPDAINAGANTINDISAGSSGANVLLLNYAGNFGSDTAPSAYFKDFQTLAVGQDGSGSFDVTGFSNLSVLTANAVTFDNVTAGTTLVVSEGSSGVVYNLKDATATHHDALALTVGTDGNLLQLASSGTTSVVELAQQTGASQSTAAVTSVSIASQGDGTAVNNVILEDAGLAHTTGGGAVTSLTVSGDNDATVSYAATGISNITSINTSASTAPDFVDVTGVAVSSTGVSITGGAATLLAEGAGALAAGANTDTAAVDVFTAGTGSAGDSYTVGAGGAWNSSTHGYDVGSETINLSGAVAATLVVRDGAVAVDNGASGGVRGFANTPSAASDALSFAVTKTVLANQGTATTVGSLANAGALATVLEPTDAAFGANLANLSYTSSNGVISFSATGTHNIGEFSASELIAATEIILHDSSSAANTVATFVSGGNTYVVSSGADNSITATDNSSSVLELVGVSTVTGFGTTAATSTILTTNTVTIPAIAVDATAAAVTISAAPSAEVSLAAGSSHSLTVNQTAAAGGDSLLVDLNGTATGFSLTTSGDYELTLKDNGSLSVLGSLNDAGGALATLTLGGAGGISIGGITAPALTTINAAGESGTLTLTATEAALTVHGGTGDNILTLAGAGDTISIGGAASPQDGTITLTAQGGGDTISINSLGGVHSVLASGAADIITLSDSGDATLYGVAANTALGTADVITLTGSGFDTLFVGQNSTVNLGTATSPFTGEATVQVTGDVAATSVTTISGAAGADLNILFQTLSSSGTAIAEHAAGGNTEFATFGGSFVNTATAGSLAAAETLAANQAIVLDAQFGNGTTSVPNGVLLQAAHTGSVDWFQYGGNTYIVEANNTGATAAAHNGLEAGDVVVKLVGLVDLSSAEFSGHTLSLSHSFV